MHPSNPALLIRPRPKIVAAGGGSVTWTPTANPAIQAGGVNPQTFNTVAIGTAAANRVVVVGVGVNSNGPVTAVTANSTAITFTKAADGFGGGVGGSLWYASVPSGTSLTDISATTTIAFPGFVGISVGVLYTSTPTPNSTAAESASDFQGDSTGQIPDAGGSLTVLSNGIGVMFGATSAPNATPTFNNWSDDYHGQISGTSLQVLLGHLSSSGVPRITGYDFAAFGMACASWGP